ncbi:MAG: hypothetical protein KF723_23060 [Rhizobiaceae bacterium]|nr:hypothetical protein [Rhizobiaceae bacterium]
MEDFGTAERARVLAAHRRRIEAEALIGEYVSQRTARLIEQDRPKARRSSDLDEGVHPRLKRLLKSTTALAQIEAARVLP